MAKGSGGSASAGRGTGASGPGLRIPNSVKEMAQRYLDQGRMIPTRELNRLGLSHDLRDYPENTSRRASIPIRKIILGRDDLNPQKLLNLAASIEKRGFGRSKRGFEINLYHNPKNGKWIASGDGNHRIAILKLAGYRGNVSAIAHYDKNNSPF